MSVGGIALDVTLELPRLPEDGECVAATHLHQSLGGKAANQAVAAARLGGAVALVGAMGIDATGDALLAQLAAEHIDVRCVQRDAHHGTGMVVLERTSHGGKQTAVFPGANATVTPAFIESMASTIAAARVVMVQFEIPLDAAVRALEIAQHSGATVILDAAPARALSPEILRCATVVKANAAEASKLTGIDVRDLDSARAAATQLLALGIELVTIEAGREGNLFRSHDEEVFLPLLDLPSIDRLGAGDTLVGALAVALSEARSLRDAALFATTAAALATQAIGAQSAMPYRTDLDARLALGR